MRTLGAAGALKIRFPVRPGCTTIARQTICAIAPGKPSQKATQWPNVADCSASIRQMARDVAGFFTTKRHGISRLAPGSGSPWDRSFTIALIAEVFAACQVRQYGMIRRHSDPIGSVRMPVRTCAADLCAGNPWVAVCRTKLHSG